MILKCPQCNTEFTPLSVTQIYCSSKCGNKYRKNHKAISPSITFDCAFCGKTVVTEDGTGDRRTRFCSAVCEKKYWRHPPFENVIVRTNFHSLQEYQSWERRTNE